MKTVEQILSEVGRVQTLSKPTLYKHLHALRIKPLGVRQRPQRYPADTSKKVLKRLGVDGKAVAR